MTNIFSGQLLSTFSQDVNVYRREDFAIDKYSKTVLQQSEQGQREQEFKSGLEFHQAIMADLQTRLNEMIEKLNNLYRRFMENKAAFRKVALGDDYYDTSKMTNNLENAYDGSGSQGHPAGPFNAVTNPAGSDILPYDDPSRIRNYPYNPFFGSKAIDESENALIRTKWEQPGNTQENTYREFGSFWSSVAYLWGWDLDRVNATYATTNTDPAVGGITGATNSNGDNLQINITAVQPNRPMLPPLRVGDRFPLRPAQYPNNPTGDAYNYPNIAVQGIRPGGADYSHAQNTATVNDVAQDSLNWGWEFDDLPVSMEVTSIQKNADGSITPNGYKIVYDIPPTHPKYAQYRLLDGTEPMILEAPEKIILERINQEGFDYLGFIELGDANFNGAYSTPISGLGTGNATNTSINKPFPKNFNDATMTTFTFNLCHDAHIDANTEVNFDYSFQILQNELDASFSTTGDEGVPNPFWGRHDWSSSGPKNELLGADLSVTLDTEATSDAGGDPYHGPNDGKATESVKLKFYNGASDNIVKVDVILDGDINNFSININDLQVTKYDGFGINGNGGDWDQGVYNAAVPALPAADDTAPGNDTVINKFQNDKFQFTQFYNNYDLDGPETTTDLHDIMRSPYEYGFINVLEDPNDAANKSDLGGEMWVDFNGRRLNLGNNNDLEAFNNLLAQPDFDPTSSFSFMSAGVQMVYGFQTVEHPDDICKPSPDPDPSNHAARYSESDPYSVYGSATPAATYAPQVENFYLQNAYDNRQTLYTPASTTPLPDPLRTVNPAWGNPATYYTPDPGSYVNGANNDQTSTIDRVTGSDDMRYTLAVPTTDINILRKSNDMVVNLGSIENRDFAIDFNEPFLQFRTVPDYKTVPRYRVDAFGNIFDRFGKGFYDPGDTTDPVDSPDDAAITDLYTTRNHTNDAAASAQTLFNTQVSNVDGIYDNAANYDSNDAAGHKRLSGTGDDFNLFDYVPDLIEDVTVPQGATLEGKIFRGEQYAGSLPSNFYYYREDLDGTDNSGNPTNGVPGQAGGSMIDDKKPALNFDARKSNLDGKYTAGNTTVVHNTHMPSWANVIVGYTEQNANLNNQQGKTSTVTWKGFPGLGSDTAPAKILVSSANVTTPQNVIGTDYGAAAIMDNGGQMIMDTLIDTSKAGHLLVYERYQVPDPNDTSNPPDPSKVIQLTEPHAIPLPLEPGYELEFDSYVSKKTMTRTGSTDTILHIDNGVPFLSPPKFEPIFIEVQNPATGIWEQQQINDIDAAINLASHPQTLTLPAPLSFVPGPDTPVRMPPPKFKIKIEDTPSPAVSNSRITLSFDSSASVPGAPFPQAEVVAVEVSPEMDRVGRGVYDDARTSAVEAGASLAISPEYFDGSPHGYVQPDAELGLRLISQDQRGNQVPRKLKSVKVTLDAGEQIIMGANGAIKQVYSTEDISSGEWPIALFDGDTQLNPALTNDLGILVGYYQGVAKTNTGNGSVGSPLKTVDVTGFQVGQEVTVGAERRLITAINTSTNTLTFDQPLTAVPTDGVVSLGNGFGFKDLKMYLNRSFAMSTNSPIKVEMEWDEYEVAGYPPRVDTSNPKAVTETVGFSNANPSTDIDGNITNFSALNYLVSGEGRSGGSFDNEFTNELKRIVDDPSFQEVLRHDLFKNTFISAAVNDPFGDLLSGRLLLNWDRRRRRLELMQTSFMAFYRS